MAQSVDEIRQELIDLGYTSEDLRGKSKTFLKKMLDEAKSVDKLLDNLEVTDASDVTALASGETEISTKEVDTHSPTDLGWTDYVLSLFGDNELDNGMPRTDALRRVTELLFGPFSSSTQIHQVPTIENGGRATVLVDLFLKNGQRFSGAADVFSGNTAKEFAVHAIATAETRAEGRALRKALRLTKILAAEELQGADKDEPNGTDKRIVSGMLNGLTIMCDRLNVDLTKVAVKLGYNVDVPEDLTHSQGMAISNELAKYQRNKEEIPNEVKR